MLASRTPKQPSDGAMFYRGATPRGCPSFVTLIAVIAAIGVAFPWVLIAGALAGSLVLTVLVGTREQR